MRQLQVTVPAANEDPVEKVLEDYSTDVSNAKVEKDDHNAVQFSLTVDSDQIDELTDQLKSMADLDVGDLSIRVLEQHSLIEKGRETEGGSGNLSQQEIYSKAQEFSGFDSADWGLVVVAGVVAALGIILDNIAVVIGAMMFAPLLSPLVAASISMTVGDRSLMKQSMQTALLAGSVTLLAAAAAAAGIGGDSSLLSLFTEARPLNVALAALVGSAASLASATGRQDQVAGVAVSIALVPPLAAAGIELAAMDFVSSTKGLLVAGINTLGIIVAGTVTFRSLGLKPETYYKEVEARRMWRYLPVGAGLLIISTYVVWLIQAV